MSFLPPYLQKKTKIYENILKFRTQTTQVRTWVERDAEGPSHEADFAEIQNYIAANRKRIDTQTMQETAEELAKEFKRISAIEVMNGSLNAGVLIYPRWP
jgi:arginine deiminase